jgi:hypothetical protein
MKVSGVDYPFKDASYKSASRNGDKLYRWLCQHFKMTGTLFNKWIDANGNVVAKTAVTPSGMSIDVNIDKENKGNA